MSKGVNDRFEYIKQPHIVVLLFVVIAALGVALFTGINRVRDLNRIASLETFDACREFIDDEVLCHFAAADEARPEGNYVMTSSATDGITTEISTLEVENGDRMKSVTFNGPEEIEAYVVIDAVSYVKDYADGVWGMYEDPDFISSEASVSSYDFSSAQASSVVDFRENYQAEGKEPCGDLICYKYRIVSHDDPSFINYIWFDDQDYLLRRHQSSSGEISNNTQIEYRTVTITPPSPTKPITEQDMEAFLESE